MANVKKGQITSATEWWVHLRKENRRRFWKKERSAWKKAIAKEQNES